MSLNFQSINLSEPTEEFKQSVCKNFNTSLEQLEKDVLSLREWLKSQTHLPQCASDTMLKAYLIACKNKMDRAKTKIENYYVARAELPEIFFDRDPTSQKITIDGEIIHIYTLPKLTPDGCRVNMVGFRTTEAKKFDTNAYSKRTLMAEDIKINKEAFVNGAYFVFDGRFMSMSHVMKVTPRMCYNLVHCAQNVLPVIIRGIIFINAPSYLEIILSFLRPFMKSKLFQRIHVHTKGPEVLEMYFPIALLPKDYGGEEDNSDLLNESWMKCLRDNKDWFLKEGQLKADIKVAPTEKKKEFEEMQGSFKALAID
ncbi:alpha-tocopherol transfer protein-like [Macrosteles quadrilineatus]|uniref:alpha-tocopherol transfer protein-like n=1 Tax=Macrosteles quadrilineatus TaxID=74068 RepID=UPI0023E0DFA0|nr:alpha-tocopherol transfer protein-like [Macrosteles quadrilineatus]